MNKKRISLLCFLLLLLAACGDSEPARSTAESVTTAQPTDEPTALPPTALPPTLTPVIGGSINNLQAANWTFSLSGDQPVLAHSEQGWDSGRIEPGAIIFHEGQYHLFRNGFLNWPGQTAVGYAISDDGQSWQEIGQNPLFTSSDIPWENVIAANVTSALILEDGTWVLYFHTWHTNRAVLGEGFIGRATAPTPAGPWTIDPDPVLRMNDDPAAWDGGQVSQASVIKVDEGFVMFYTGADSNGFMHIGRATSPDGIEWQKNDTPILGPDAGNWDRRGTYQPRVVQTPNGFVMLYKTFDSSPLSAYGLAFSPDNRNWEKYSQNPVLLPDAIPNGTAMNAPALLYQDSHFQLFTEAFTGSRTQTDIYLLTILTP